MIKQVLLITALTTTSAYAGMFGNIDYTYYDGVGDSSGYDANAYSLNLGGKVYDTKLDSVTLDVRTEFQDIVDTNASVNQLEGGANYQYNYSNAWGFYGRLGLGNNWVNDIGKNDFAYYSLEPGVKWYPNSNSSVGLAYRFRDSFDTADEYQTSTFRLNGEYSFDGTNSIQAGVDTSIGDIEYNAFKVGYMVRF